VKKAELTAQELRIVKLICKQLTSKEIADKVGLSYRTVEEYRGNIEKKIGAKNSVGIALYALKHGIIS
jgi:DNA-binding CsgD family transcriptional regulator